METIAKQNYFLTLFESKKNNQIIRLISLLIRTEADSMKQKKENG